MAVTQKVQAWLRGIHGFNGPALPALAGAGFPAPGIEMFFAQDMNDDDEKRTVKGTRRRKTTDSGQPRQQAETPQRGDDSAAPRSQAPTPSRPPTPTYTGSGSSTSAPPAGMPAGIPGGLGGLSGGLPGGGGGRSLIFLAVAVVGILCLGAFFIFGGGLGGGGGSDLAQIAEPPLNRPPELPADGDSASGGAVSVLPAPTIAPPVTGAGEDTWLIMLYQDADDKILEQDIMVDLNEAERVGSTPNIQIVSQIDRYGGGYTGDGNWQDTRRFHLEYDPDLRGIRSREVANLGEVNMASGETLVNFVTWAMREYPADKHVLILSDHGMGWPGGWSDGTNGGRGEDRVALANVTGDQLFLMELDEALGRIRAETGLDKFELVGMDACLMGHVEVFEALSPHARYAVASQEVEPALGWAYTGFLTDLAANPDVTGRELSEYIVASYIDEDQRIQDPEARNEWVGRGMFGAPSPEQLTRQLGDDITLTAVDLQRMPEVMNALNDLAYVLQGEDQRLVAQARQYAQGFTSIWGSNVPASYLDLVNLMAIVNENSRNPQTQEAIARLGQAVETAVVSERSGPKKAGANGLSIYFPNSDLYRSPAAGAASYTEVAARFAENSLWDDFLTFHYTGRQFSPADRLPSAAAAADVTAPGQGEITVSPLRTTADSVARGDTITLSADIAGENIGYIKFFAGFLDQASNSIYIADTDYIDSGETREVGGVYYPDWGEGEFTLEFEWEPIVFGINDGTNIASALFQPETYGASIDDAVYRVDGAYTYADGQSYPAQMYFNNRDGLMREVFGFAGDPSAGAPREIIPNVGDSFTVAEQWLDQTGAGQPAQPVVERGQTIVFGNQQPAWEVLDAAPGPYVVGFLIEDLDGQVYPVYAEVVVQ